MPSEQELQNRDLDEPNPVETPAEAQAPEQPTVEEELLEAPQAEPGADVGELLQQIEALTRRAEENWDRFVRAQSEIENIKKRNERDLQNAHRYALERFVKDLLPVLDSLELGIQAATSDQSGVTQLREGAELTLKQFHAVLERYQVTVIDPVGERFDPERHQAMVMQPTAEAEPLTVLQVLQKGYTLHDRLLRPAMVIVAQAVS